MAPDSNDFKNKGNSRGRFGRFEPGAAKKWGNRSGGNAENGGLASLPADVDVGRVGLPYSSSR